MTDQAPAAPADPLGGGWRDQPGGNELWTQILKAFVRAAESPSPTSAAAASPATGMVPDVDVRDRTGSAPI